MPVQQVLTDQRVRQKIAPTTSMSAPRRNWPTSPFCRSSTTMSPPCRMSIWAKARGPTGSVIATHQAIIPAAVGVDIGCGMVAARLSITASGPRRKSPEEGL